VEFYGCRAYVLFEAGNHETRIDHHSSRGAAEPLLTTLTKHEREIVCLVSEGLSNKEIARRLNLCDGTIKVHLHHVYQKLPIRNRMTLAGSGMSNDIEQQLFY
jgi:DNA-binding NarL/FixJ family response regulator